MLLLAASLVLVAVMVESCTKETADHGSVITFSNPPESQRFKGDVWLGAASSLIEFEHYLLGIGENPRLYMSYRNISSEPIRLDMGIEWTVNENMVLRSVRQHDIRGIMVPGQSESLVYKPSVVSTPSTIVNYLILIYLPDRVQLPYPSLGLQVSPVEASGTPVVPCNLEPPINFYSWSEAAIDWALEKVGNREWSNYCLRFVANAFRQQGPEPEGEWHSAWEASQNLALCEQDHIGAPRGALIFFGQTEKNQNGHVGIYLGNGKLLHAYGSVRIDDLDEVKTLENGYLIGPYIGWAYPPEKWRPAPTPEPIHATSTTPAPAPTPAVQGKIAFVSDRDEDAERSM